MQVFVIFIRKFSNSKVTS